MKKKKPKKKVTVNKPKAAPPPKPVRVVMHYRKMTREQVYDALCKLAKGLVGGLPHPINPRDAAGCLEQCQSGIGAGLTLGYQINKLTGLAYRNLEETKALEDLDHVCKDSLAAAKTHWSNADTRVPFQEHHWLGTPAPAYKNPFGESSPQSPKIAPSSPSKAPKGEEPAPGKDCEPRANLRGIPVGVNGGSRWKVFGLAVTKILRWCGYDGWSVEDATRLMTVLKIPEVGKSTVLCQVRSGKAGDDGPHGPVPKLTEVQETLLRQAIEERECEDSKSGKHEYDKSNSCVHCGEPKKCQPKSAAAPRTKKPSSKTSAGSSFRGSRTAERGKRKSGK